MTPNLRRRTGTLQRQSGRRLATVSIWVSMMRWANDLTRQLFAIFDSPPVGEPEPWPTRIKARWAKKTEAGVPPEPERFRKQAAGELAHWTGECLAREGYVPDRLAEYLRNGAVNYQEMVDQWLCGDSRYRPLADSEWSVNRDFFNPHLVGPQRHLLAPTWDAFVPLVEDLQRRRRRFHIKHAAAVFGEGKDAKLRTMCLRKIFEWKDALREPAIFRRAVQEEYIVGFNRRLAREIIMFIHCHHHAIADLGRDLTDTELAHEFTVACPQLTLPRSTMSKRRYYNEPMMRNQSPLEFRWLMRWLTTQKMYWRNLPMPPSWALICGGYSWAMGCLSLMVRVAYRTEPDIESLRCMLDDVGGVLDAGDVRYLVGADVDRDRWPTDDDARCLPLALASGTPFQEWLDKRTSGDAAHCNSSAEKVLAFIDANAVVTDVRNDGTQWKTGDNRPTDRLPPASPTRHEPLVNLMSWIPVYALVSAALRK